MRKLSLADIIADLDRSRAATKAANKESGRLQCELEVEQIAHKATRFKLGTAIGDLARAKDELAFSRSGREARAKGDQIDHLKGEVRRLGQRGDDYKVKTHALLADLEKANARIRVLERDRMCAPYGARPMDPCVNTLFGRSFEDWSRIDHLMKCSRATVTDIERLLIGRRFENADPKRDLEVYDRENQKRHLGTLIGGRERFARFAEGPAPVFCVVEPRIAAVSYKAYDSVPMGFAEYRYEFRIAFKPNGWDQTAVLLTEAPLKELRKLPYFRVSGESAEQHYERNRRDNG